MNNFTQEQKVELKKLLDGMWLDGKYGFIRYISWHLPNEEKDDLETFKRKLEEFHNASKTTLMRSIYDLGGEEPRKNIDLAIEKIYKIIDEKEG